MYRKVLKTYNRKNNGKLDFSSIQGQSTIKPVEITKNTEKEIINDTFEDPHDTTFDRILREFKNKPNPPPVQEISYDSYTETDIDSSFINQSSSDSDDDFVYKAKSRKMNLKLNKQSSRLEKQKSSKLLDEQETKKSQLTKKTKSKKLIHDDTHSSFNFVSSEKENTLNDKSNNNKFQHSNLKSCSILLKQCDLIMSKKQENIVKLKPCSIKLSRLRVNSLPETIHNNLKRKSEEKFINNFKRQRIENEENDEKKSNTISQSINDESYDEIVNKSKKKSIKNIEKKKRRSAIIFENLIRNSIGAKENVKKLRKVQTPPKIDSPIEIKSPIILKECSVNLTRINSPSISFTNNFVSSTPFIKKNINLHKQSLPLNLEISNITSPIVKQNIPSTPDKQLITSNQFKEPSSIPLKNINKSKTVNLQNDLSENFQDNTENWNNSSDYSEIEWETINESELSKEPSLQRKFRLLPPNDKTKANLTKNSSSITDTSFSINDRKNKETLINKSLEVSLERCHVGTKRFLNKSPEYEKSMSLCFDDTKSQDDNLNSSSVITTDSKDLKKFSSVSVKLTKLEYPESYNNSSILNQSDLKGFERKLELSLKKLSPMTSIPTSIVYSIAVEDSRNDISLINDTNKKKEKSLEFENSSLRRCLNYDEEPEIQNINNNVSPIKKDKTLNDTNESNSEISIIESSLKEDDEVKRKSHLEVSVILSPLKMEKSQYFQKKETSNQIIENSTIDSGNSFESTSAIKNTQEFVLDDNNSSLKVSQDSGQVNDSLTKSSQDSMNDDSLTKKGQYEKYVKPFKQYQINSQEEIMDAETVIYDKNDKNNIVTKAVNASEINSKESLKQLKDSVKITQRRKKYQNWGWRLSDISENESRNFNENEIINDDDEVIPKEAEKNANISSISNNSLIEQSQPEQHLFLKPGKSWARSLSILNNIHSQTDVDRFSVGKGKKWRHSVISILDMQNKGNLQSCIKEQETSNSNSPIKDQNGIVEYPRIERFSQIGSTSPSRLFKRISIRVVPDVKKFDINNEDTQFLEAYGIPSSQTKTVSSIQENDKSIASPEKSLLHSQDSIQEIIDSQPLTTAKCVVLEKCHQTEYLPFNQCYPKKFLKSCRKIGEGVYGEVFLYNNETDSSVIKIIPIEGDELVNGEPQKKFHEILSEIVIAKELHDLRFNEMYNTSSFVEVKNIKCIEGKYPSKLIEHWQTYDNEKKSENDCPSMFKNDQLYISLELGNGGQDLEAFVFQNSEETYSVFLQIAIAMAVAEQSLEFEHRDMHWGNILISRTKKSQFSYKLGNLEINLPSNGLKVAIIDFTLSRMSYKGCCIFNDLALDPALFTAEGEYQFEIYRLMRDKLGNDWQTFEPYTNILWLHYTLDKMIKAVRYNKKKMTSKIHKNGIEKLKNLKTEILFYDSAFDLVTKCDKFTVLYEDFNSSTDDNDK